jgi:hypothetical protein
MSKIRQRYDDEFRKNAEYSDPIGPLLRRKRATFTVK